jgi:V8-like Glu-specific endopeptidase
VRVLRVQAAAKALRTHRVASIACVAALITVGLSATGFAKADERAKLHPSSTSQPTGSTQPHSTDTSSDDEEARSAVPTRSSTPQVPAAAATTISDSMSVSDPLEGEPFSGVPQVGTLFGTSGGSLTSHHCTGSVVSSPEGDIVVTAAHCVYNSSGAETDLAFVPEYDNGDKPFGVWDVSAVYVAPQWITDRDTNYDVAFIVVHKSGSSTPIQDVVGADTLAVDQSFTGLTNVIGYPSDTNRPITCTNYTTEFSSTQLQFDCDGFPGGTSGSPFLTDVNAKTGLGTVVGVIGGYQAGGDSPDISYSVHFTDSVSQLLAKAEAAN